MNEEADGEEDAKTRWSMGKTLFAMGKKEAAYEQFRRATNTTQRNEVKKGIRLWTRRNVSMAKHLLPQNIAVIDVDLPYPSE